MRSPPHLARPKGRGHSMISSARDTRSEAEWIRLLINETGAAAGIARQDDASSARQPKRAVSRRSRKGLRTPSVRPGELSDFGRRSFVDLDEDSIEPAKTSETGLQRHFGHW
jgi:hypothetical protein